MLSTRWGGQVGDRPRCPAGSCISLEDINTTHDGDDFLIGWGAVSVSFTTGFSGRIMNALIMTGPELEGHDRTAYSPFGQWGRPGQKRILRPHAAQILHLASASLMAILGFYSPDQPTLIKTKMIILLVVTTNLIQSQDRSMHASENPKRSVTRPPSPGFALRTPLAAASSLRAWNAELFPRADRVFQNIRLKRPARTGQGCKVHHGPVKPSVRTSANAAVVLLLLGSALLR